MPDVCRQTLMGGANVLTLGADGRCQSCVAKVPTSLSSYNLSMEGENEELLGGNDRIVSRSVDAVNSGVTSETSMDGIRHRTVMPASQAFRALQRVFSMVESKQHPASTDLQPPQREL